MLKQFFRELPEPLLTTKLSDTFISICLDVPPEHQLDALQKAIILLPDENREVLQSLLLFLHDIALHSDTNQVEYYSSFLSPLNLQTLLHSSLFVSFASSIFGLNIWFE